MEHKRHARALLLLLPVLVILTFAWPAWSASSNEPSDSSDNADTDSGSIDSDSDEAGSADADDNLYADEVDDAPEPDFDPNSIDLSGKELASLPCLSVGSASGGRLVNGIELKSAPGMLVRNGDHNWGTPETIASLQFGVARVNQEYPKGTPLVVIGDISARSGGRLRPHRSHQSGRDVDIGYYYKGMGQPRTFIPATASNLDVPRTWALIEAFLDDNKTEYIFIDSSIQRVLYNYVKYKLKAPDSYLQTVFSVASPSSRSALIRHARGHQNHMHVRFWSPIAVAAARNQFYNDATMARVAQAGGSRFKGDAYVALDSLEKVDRGPMPEFQTVKEWRTAWTTYTVRKGDTPGGIAKRYHVSTSQLAAWNGLKKGGMIRAGRKLKVKSRQLVEVQVPVPRDWQEAPAASVASVEQPPLVVNNPAADKASAAAPAVDTTAANIAPQPEFRSVTRYSWAKVKSGDTLSAIAKRSKTSADKIARLNGLSKKSVLRPGQSLKVKSWTEHVAVEKTVVVPTAEEPAADADPTADTVADALENAQPEQAAANNPDAPLEMEYRVMRGDTIYSIAQRFGVEVIDLCTWNGLKPSQELKVGTRILLKVKSGDTDSGKADDSAA